MVDFNKPKHLIIAEHFNDPPAPSTSESTGSIISALTQYLPGYMAVQNAQLGPQANAQLEVAKQISPQYSELLNGLYQKYAPQLAQTGVNVDAINRQGAANTDLNILRGSGGDLAKEAVGIDKQLNPEYYKTRALEGDKLSQLLGSINLDNANPEAERLINQESARTGNNTVPQNATNTVSNALSFGSQLQSRRDSLSQALSTATNFLQPSQGQFNPVVTALNRPSSNTGNNQFQGVTNPSNQAYNSGNQLLQTATAANQQSNQINANRRDTLDRVTQVMGSVSV